MYYKDLTPFRYSTAVLPGNTLNVGWLSREHPFPVGDTPEEFRRALRELAAEAVNDTRGWHDCEFCEAPLRRFFFWRRSHALPDWAARGNGEIHVPAPHGNIVYAAPCLVVHYVDEHDYLPPAEFVEAVMAYTPLVKSIPWEAIRSHWKKQLPALDEDWTQWRIFSRDWLLAVIPAERLPEVFDVLQRQLEMDISARQPTYSRFEISRSCRGMNGEGVVIEPVRHEMTCPCIDIPVRPIVFPIPKA